MSGLHIRDIHLEYGPRTALRGVSLDVEEGQIVALVGSNGAGKTSTLRAVIGLRQPSKGEIVFNDARIDQLTPPDIVARGIALAPEGRRVFPRITVHDNLLLGGYLQRDGSVLRANVERMFTYFPKLRERRNQLAGSLSGGEQQMLAIARALMSRPRVLLLDEPSMGLSPIMVDKIFEVVKDVSARGVTVLLVEQNASRALGIADRGYVMESGIVTMNGDARELLNDPRVRAAYLGE
jgi:branched-chain amino acid transport system ATP-binding protein